jgi:hypothetical protein
MYVRRKRVNEAVGLARSHAFSRVFAENDTGFLHLFRRDARGAQEHAEIVIALCAEHGFSQFLAYATVLRGAAMANQ